MPNGQHERESHDSDDLLDIMTAVAAGHATRQDAVAELRERNVDALDILVEVFARQARAESRTRRRRYPDVQSFTTRRRTDAPEPHRVPLVPVLVRGTLYDPADITRFNGTELHFINTDQGHLLAIDDPAVMDSWWQMAYLTSVATLSRTLPTDTAVTLSTRRAATGMFGGSTGDMDHTLPNPWFGGCTTSVVPPPVPHTNFYEHPGFGGDRLELDYVEGGISDMTDHHLGGIFSGDDWNDKISSIQMVRTTFTRIWDDVQFSGNSFVTGANVDNLAPLGWDDRTSSAETHGATYAAPQLVTSCSPSG